MKYIAVPLVVYVAAESLEEALAVVDEAIVSNSLLAEDRVAFVDGRPACESDNEGQRVFYLHNKNEPLDGLPSTLVDL